MNNTNNPSITNGHSSTNKMFDLKMCLLDFMRITTNGTRQKKTLKEMSNRFPSSQYMHHNFNHDLNMIYFNENMSMTSRCSTIKFSRCPTGNFKPNPITMTKPCRSQRLYEWIDPKRTKQSLKQSSLTPSYSRFSLNSVDDCPRPLADHHRNGLFSDCSSDERGALSTTEKSISSITESPFSESSVRETETDEYLCSYSDCGQTVADATSVNGLDSFCTLCTSSFSFNRCNQCEDSSCGSKCNLSQKSVSNRLIDAIGDAGGGESSASGAISSDCESVLYR